MTGRGALAVVMAVAVLCPGGGAGALAHAAERSTLTLAFPDMAPFLLRDPDSQAVVGPLADRLEGLARAAGVELRWVGPMPRPRIWAALEADRPVCHPNARSTPERRARFKMTEPVFDDATFRVVRLRGANAPRHPTLLSMLQDEGLVFGRLLGSSFGPQFDAVIDARTLNVAAIRGSAATLLKMIQTGRIDFALIAVNDLELEAAAIGVDPAEFEMVDLPDLPRGDGGRIICSRSVPDRLIQALNAALQSEAGTGGQEITR